MADLGIAQNGNFTCNKVWQI